MGCTFVRSLPRSIVNCSQGEGFKCGLLQIQVLYFLASHRSPGLPRPVLMRLPKKYKIMRIHLRCVFSMLLQRREAETCWKMQTLPFALRADTHMPH